MTQKEIYEKYGLTICARNIRQSKEHVCRQAKKAGWRAPTNEEIADNVLRLVYNQ
ncbi:hypothetical protein BCT96_005055 [Vibrio splendidus]|uniref:hypothetical protein n=1 Tax=Vibrio splendidus TaxID=29497 RepID=UPI00130010FB|nr:hypothetical protein [Vibrio splendidus]